MIPLVLGWLAALAGATGVVAGAEAVSNFKKAEKTVKDARRGYKNARNRLSRHRKDAEELIRELGKLTVESYNLLGRFSNFMEKLGTRVHISKKDVKRVQEISSDVESIRSRIELLKVEDIGLTVGNAALTGGMAYIGAVGLGTAVGVASTGTPIASLSGAAFTNALLAWFGGGAVSAGGGGIALGTAVLGGIVAGPALCIGGILLAEKSEKALTKAKEYEEEVEEAIAKIDITVERLKTLKDKIRESIKYRRELKMSLEEKLNELENKSKPSVAEVKTLIGLAKNLKEAIESPVISEEEVI